MSFAYEPATDLKSRIARRLTEFRAQNIQPIKAGKAIISFTFDDCPLSAIDNGVKEIEIENWKSTIYVACGLFESCNHLGKHMSREDTIALHNNGHEIGEHTFSHQDANTMGLESFLKDVSRNQAELSNLGLPPSRTIAYPYGQTYPALKSVMAQQFLGARGISPKIHKKQVDLSQIGSVPMFSQTMDRALKAIDQVKRGGGWLTLFTHDIRENPSSWGCTQNEIKTIIRAVKDSGADVLPVKDAILAIGDAT